MNWFNPGQHERAIRETIEKYALLEHQIKELTGFNLEALRDLFAMGYTLKRPDHDLTLTQLTKIMEMYD